MRQFAGIVCFLGLIIVILPDLAAQDKNEPAKKEKEPEVVYGVKVPAKFKRLDANSAREFTVEVADPLKVAKIQVWQAEQANRIARITQHQLRAQSTLIYQQELAQKQANEIYTLKVDMRATEDCKVRSMMPPVEHDEKGRLKKWTSKELKDLKGNSKLPGYPADFDRLAAGQMVKVYLAKTAKTPAKGDNSSKKKAPAELDPATKPEAVMIVIEQEAPPAR